MTGLARRRLGTALLGFGAVGLALLVTLAILVGISLDGLGRAVSDLELQRAEAIAMLRPAAAALDEAAASAEKAGTSLISAAGAARRAADLMTRLAGSFDGLATLGSFDLFGTRPFSALTGEFSAVAAESRALSADLATTAVALDANVVDSTTVAADLRALADQLHGLGDSAGGGDTATSDPAVDPGTAGTLFRVAMILIVALLAWLAVPAIAAIGVGRRWRRASDITADSRVDSAG